MMKINTKLIKIFAIFLSALLVAGIVFPLVMAESNLLEGQKELFVKNVTSPPVQDGILNGHKVDGVTVDEYGANGPTFCLTHEDYRAIDLEGNPLNIDLPSYIYLYMAKDADALYLAMEIQEDAHVGDVYEFTTFLGFGSSDDADTMNSGTFTTFKMDNSNSARNDPGTWMDTQVTALSAQKVAADGTVTNTTANRKFNVPYEYTLPAWASETKSGTKSVILFEAELDFKDAMLGSGLEASASLPDQAYFAFELGVFDGTTKIGKIVFNNDMTGKTGAPNGETKTVPHVLNLKTEFKVGSANNANLSSLTVEGGKLSPAFDANTTEYTLTLPNGTTAVSVSAIAEVDETAVTVVGADQIDSITAGANNTITITCVAQNGYTKVYTLFISWAYDSFDYYVDSATGNDFSGNGSETAPYATIEKALQAVAAKEWKVSEAATIHINGTFDATAPDGVLFGAKTVFTTSATRLPITIKGDSKTDDVINAFAGKAACANSYHFDTMTFTFDTVSSATLFAGSGEVRFDNINWTTATTLTRTTPIFYGDTFTASVFEGWTSTEIEKAKSQSERGNLVTSLTIGENSEYWIAGSSGQYLNASGDNGGWENTDGIVVKSTDVEVTAILDGSRVSRLAVYYPNSAINSYAHAGVVMLSGSTHRIGVDRNDGSTRLVINNDVSIEVFGGTSVASSSFIRGLCADTVNGDMTITIESGTWQYLQGAMSDNTYVYGDVIMNIGGTANITGHATGGLGSSGSLCSGTLYNRVYGNATVAKFRASREGTTVVYNKIVNEVSGGTITEFTGINNKEFESRTTEVINNISGGTITYLYGAYWQDVKSVTNNISGGTITNFYGHYKAEAESVTNNVSGSANITNYYGIYDMKTVDNVNQPIGNDYGVVKNNVSGGTFDIYIGAFTMSKCTSFENEITGGTFNKFYGTSSCEIPTANNNIKGGIFTSFFGSYKDKLTTLNNNVSGGTFVGTKNADTTGNESGYEMLNGSFSSTIQTQNNNFTGGNLGGIAGENRSTVTNMNNTFDGATSARVFGTYQGTATNVHNVIKSGTFTKGFDGCYRSTTSSVLTDVTGGEFQSTFYPSWARYDTINSSVTNISAGTFMGTIHGAYGGAYNSVENNISGGTFKTATIYLGAGSGTWPSAVNGNVTNNISGGDFTEAVAVYGGANCGLVKGNIINNITGGTFGVFYGGNFRAYTNSSDSKLVAGTEFKGNSVLGKIVNTFGAENAESGPVFNSYVFGGDLGDSIAVTQYGSIENTVNAATFNATFYGGTDTVRAVASTIKNTINGGTFKANFFGGCNDGEANKIVNVINGGTFEGIRTKVSNNNYKYDTAIFLGSRDGAVTSIENTINGGTFKALITGGGGPSSTTGSITNTITGGTFNYNCSGAGFGNVTGNVTATLKGTANFKEGYFAIHPAKYTASSVSGNVITTVTKDENGNAPTFGKALGLQFAIADVFSGSYNLGHTNLGLGTGGYAMVGGYVETTIEAGTFSGHYYATGYFAEVSGTNADGYSVITHVKGTPTFDYNYAGTAITTYKMAGGVYNDIQGGVFNYDFNGGGRSGFCNKVDGTNVWNVPIDTVIDKNAVFDCTIHAFNGPWSTDMGNNSILAAPVTLTINGGTFNGNIFGFHTRSKDPGSPIMSTGGSVAINIHGGTFNGAIFPSLNSNINFSKVAEGASATLTIAPTKANVVIHSNVAPVKDIDRIVLAGGEYQLILGADASIEATSATGNVKLGQAETWKKQTYVTMPEGNDAVVTVTGTHCFDKVGNSVVAVKGGVQLYGATMILTDRVAVRALFDKASVDAIDNFTFSFTMDGNTLASGTKADLVSYNDDYYCIVLAKIGASDFTETVTFSGNDMVWENTFSIESLAKLAEVAWAGNEVDVALAKAMQNFAAIVAGNTLPYGDLKPDLTKLGNFKASASKDDDASFKVTGKGLVMSNAVGIRIYGTSEKAITANSFTIKVNGTDVTAKALVGAGANAGEYIIDLFVNAKNMSDVLTIEIVEKDSGKLCVKLIDRVDAIAAAYDANHENYEKAQQLLIYIQAAVAYASK